MTGRLVAVVGPSGVGKDSVMDGLVQVMPGLARVRRSITRGKGLGGEHYDALIEADFSAACAAGAYCLHWRAHGLGYGIPAEVLSEVEGGADRLVNLSRSVLNDAHSLFPRLIVLNLTARPETLARRIAGRGREGVAEIERRLSRPAPVFAAHLDIRTISNDGPLQETVAAAARHVQGATDPAPRPRG